MQLRLSNTEDIPAIMSIIHDAQAYLAQQNIDQWQNGYPNIPRIEQDIALQESYVLLDAQQNIIATTVLSTRPEPTYTIIEGQWITPADTVYGVIHRLAIKASQRKQGLATLIVEQCEQRLLQQSIYSLRIDTHEDNKGMQRLLTNRGYTYCGVIYLANGDKRLAFEKTL